MNRTLVILNILIASTSIAKPIDEETTTTIEVANYRIDDQTRGIPDETDDVLPVLVKKDDVISTSDLNKVYSSLENKFAKTRTLKDETEHERFDNVDKIQESRVGNSNLARKIKSEELEEKSSTTEEEEIKPSVRKVEGKSSERRSLTAKVESKTKTEEKETKSGATVKAVEESKSATKEKNKTKEVSRTTGTVNGESINAKKEESKTVEVTSELNELEKTTTSFRRQVKNADYLEDDEYEISDKVADDEDSERKAYEIPINDETNASWDDLDDIPESRRMLSQPDNLSIDIKAKSGDEKFEVVEARIVPETKLASRNHNIPHGSSLMPTVQFQSTVSVPHIHPDVLSQRRLIVPGYIKVPIPAVSFNLRRLLHQDRNIVRNQHEPLDRSAIYTNNVNNRNVNFAADTNERLEMPSMSRNVVENYNAKDFANAYPYTSVDLSRFQTSQASTVNPLFAKLIEASEHPQRLNHNINGENVQNYPGMAYNNYAMPQNYGVYKYVNGLRHLG